MHPVIVLFLAACSDDTLKVRNTPPSVAFMAPADGATVPPNVDLTLVAEVGDPESPLEELSSAPTA
jgi:hypothetical protein